MQEYQYEDLNVGDEASFQYDINEETMALFAKITGDENPLHTDEDYARANGYQERVVYGQLTAAALSTLAGMVLPGRYSLIHSIETSFVKPVYLSDCPLTVKAVVKEKDDRFRTMIVKYNIYNTAEQKVCKGKMRIGFTS